jgi:hypothetical protein
MCPGAVHCGWIRDMQRTVKATQRVVVVDEISTLGSATIALTGLGADGRAAERHRIATQLRAVRIGNQMPLPLLDDHEVRLRR